MTTIALGYQFAIAISEPPIEGELRLNDADQRDATVVWVSVIADDGVDTTALWESLTVGSQIAINDANDPALGHVFGVTGPAIDNTDYFAVPIDWMRWTGNDLVAGAVTLSVPVLVGGWTTAQIVIEAIGPTAPAASDAYLDRCVQAANVAAFRKRQQAGYDDDPLISPGPDVTMGTTLWAIALWRERASTDGYTSFEDLSSFQPTGGSWGQIKRLLGIGKAQSDALPAGVSVSPYRHIRRRIGGYPTGIFR